jgi:hypothetical protein
MYAILIILFGLLHIADGIVTYLGLSFFGLEEVNPVLTFSSGVMGLGLSILLFKLAELGFLAFLFSGRRQMRNRWVHVTMASAVGFYGVVVTNNVALVVGS